MNTDLEAKSALIQLKLIGMNHSKGLTTTADIYTAMQVLGRILIYAHRVSESRNIQVFQVEENIGAIRCILNDAGERENIGAMYNHIDNLERYIQIQ